VEAGSSASEVEFVGDGDEGRELTWIDIAVVVRNW